MTPCWCRVDIKMNTGKMSSCNLALSQRRRVRGLSGQGPGGQPRNRACRRQCRDQVWRQRYPSASYRMEEERDGPRRPQRGRDQGNFSSFLIGFDESGWQSAWPAFVCAQVFVDGSLYLTNVQLIHSGNYTCHAQRNRDVVQRHLLHVHSEYGAASSLL